MRIAILGPWSIERLSALMEKLMTESNWYLFTVVCGGTSDNGRLRESIGCQWADSNGAPVEFLIEENPDKLVDKLVNKIDFVVALDDGNPIVRKIIMKMNMAGKHGRVEKK